MDDHGSESRREMYEIYVVLSNRAVMRVKVGFRTKISNVLQVLLDNFGYTHAHNALVLTEIKAPVFPDYDGPDEKERKAKHRLALTVTEFWRFAQLTHRSTMEENCVWVDGVIYVIVENAKSRLVADESLEVDVKGQGADDDSDVNSDSDSKSAIDDSGKAKKGSRSSAGGGGGPDTVATSTASQTKPASSVSVKLRKSHFTPTSSLSDIESKEDKKDIWKPESFMDLLAYRHIFKHLDASQLIRRRNVELAPTYRRFGDGVNYECTCSNAGCPAYRKQVIVNVGFARTGRRPYEEVYLLRAVKCPLCKLPVPSISAFGFSNCKFEWKGITVDGHRREYRGSTPPFRYSVYSGTQAVSIGSTTTVDTSSSMNWEVLVVSAEKYVPPPVDSRVVAPVTGVVEAAGATETLKGHPTPKFIEFTVNSTGKSPGFEAKGGSAKKQDPLYNPSPRVELLA